MYRLGGPYRCALGLGVWVGEEGPGAGVLGHLAVSGASTGPQESP